MDETKLQEAAEARGTGARLEYVDIAKGVMILAVVLSHAWFADSDLLGNWLPFSMPVFFFLSGYTYKPGRGYGRNLWKRVVTLLLPYLFFCSFCNCFYPVYKELVRQISEWSYAFLAPTSALWIAVLKADALGMAMSTPMWFLVSLFTASVLFFLVADKARGSLGWTLGASAVLVALALVIDLIKPGQLPWYVDLAPFAAALMLLGSYCGEKKLFANLNARGIVIGLALLLISEVLNRVFPGSARNSIVQYIDSHAWYGVLTALVIAVTGCIGTLCVARLLQKVPVVRNVFLWLGQNSLWILCIHYCFIMLVELWLFTKGQLTNSLLDVVTFQLYGFGHVEDTPKDFVIKVAVALVSIGVSAIYIFIHKAVKRRIRAARAAKNA